MPKIRKKPYKIYNEDCFETFKRIEPGSVDLVLVDPPYGTTASPWDSIIPLDKMWESLNELLSAIGTFVFTSTQPFTTALISSNVKNFRYCWVWQKSRVTGHAHSKNRPMRAHEDVVVFSKGTTSHKSRTRGRMVYNPQGLVSGYETRNGNLDPERRDCLFPHSKSHQLVTCRTYSNYPRTILKFAGSNSSYHPNQKPILLMEYLIKTYTNPGDLVLDFAMGSGTTGVACMRTDRRFIGCDSDTHFGYFDIAKLRIENQLEKANAST